MIDLSASRRKFTDSIASVGRLAAGHSDGCFQHPETITRLKRRYAIVFGVVALMLPYNVLAQKPQGKGKPKPPASGSKALLGAGRTLFVKNCSPCHGANGQGGEGPNLQKMSLTEAAISTTIKIGIKGEMPAFGGKFKADDIKALTAFVRSIKTSG